MYGIVKQTGGGGYLESQEGQGTTFLVYLPQVPGTLPRRDAMPEGGQLTLSTRNERAEATSPERPGLAPALYAVLSVADTGTGVPIALREHVFEPFFTTKEQGKGTGLGLATVYGIVKQTGGGVYLESQEGQGTTFLVYLPQAQESSALSASL